VRKADDLRVALKKVSIFDMMDAKARERCLKEVKLLQTLPAHPCIILYIDSFIDSNELYIVFEWAEHGDLRRLLKRAQAANTSLQEPQIWRYFVQICDAIRHMHDARVMHRDIKPANIFLATHGRVKLGDLGLGRAFSSHTYEAMSKVGTPLYMSPEVLDGRGYEWKSDVWSLGCLLYELASLRSPFKAQGDNLFMLFKKISSGKFAPLPQQYSQQLSQLVGSMIQVDPAHRPDACTTLRAATKALAAFDNALNDQPGARPEDRRASEANVSAADSMASATSDACMIVMDAVADKLKLLDYESGLLRPRALPPLPRGYFCLPTVWPVAPMFGYFFQLCCWLLHISAAPQHQLWQLLPAQGSPSFDAESQAASFALLDQLSQCGASLVRYAEVSSHKMRTACGPEVCALLNALTDVALSGIKGLSWVMPKQLEAEDEEIEEIDCDQVEENRRAGHRPLSHGVEAEQVEAEEDEEAEAAEQRGKSGRLLPVLPSTLDGDKWREECARISTQLVVRRPYLIKALATSGLP